MYNAAPMADFPTPALTIPAAAPPLLSIGIVTHHTADEQLERCLQRLIAACAALPPYPGGVELTLIDNSEEAAAFTAICACADRHRPAAQAARLGITAMRSPANLGYGGGNNLAIEAARSRYHLIMNPDTYLDADALCRGIDYLDAHPDTVMLAPRGTAPDGTELFLAKDEPTLLVLLLRALDNRHLNHLFQRPLARYELRACYGSDRRPFTAPLASGCCMLARTAALQQVGGFDRRYFLYFEDFDLSHRLGQLGSIVVHPAVHIIHEGGGTWHKGLRHRLLFLRSMFTFFYRYGWKLS